jgi:hypothetical protein
MQELLFLKDEVNCQNQKDETNQVIPLKRFTLKDDQSECGEYDEGDDFLKHFQLDQREWPSVLMKANPVRRDLETIFKKSDTPTDEDNRD